MIEIIKVRDLEENVIENKDKSNNSNDTCIGMNIKILKVKEKENV